MKFGPTPLDQAEGAILAHSLRLPGGAIKKGVVLTADHIAALAVAGLTSVVAARLEPDDMPEDAAAAAVAAALAPDPAGSHLRISAPFAGRVNLYALAPGLAVVDAALVSAVNGLHEAITLATLRPFARVEARRMIATIKIIPYAAPRAAVAEAEALLRVGTALRIAPFRRRPTALILTRTQGQPDKVIAKGAQAVADRLAALGQDAPEPEIIPHEAGAVAAALKAAEGEAALVLAASATSDRNDVVPAGLVAAGGAVDRLGMPVDPGNLLMTGRLGEKQVICLPGCARSPKLNGADWSLERFYAGLPATPEEIAGMGVGGLLKEIEARPQPRAGGAAAMPFVSVLLLAAGGSSRMGDEHKLLKEINEEPLLRRSARRLCESAADEVIVALGARAEEMRPLLSGLRARAVVAEGWRGGMAESLKTALAARSPRADAVIIALADMPDIGPDHLHRLIAAFSPEDGREIIRLTTASGAPGHPVLFGHRFFAELAALAGDAGARSILAAHGEVTALVPAADNAPLTDLDDLAAWREYEACQSGVPTAD